jgi:CheY-like chemotaxis protein
VVLMDLLMPGMDGIEATRQLKARWPVIEVVAVTSFLAVGSPGRTRPRAQSSLTRQALGAMT